MANPKEQFDWHITQAMYHANAAINLSLGDHRINLSETEKTVLETVQNGLEMLKSS